MEVSNDLLRTIEEVDKGKRHGDTNNEESYDRSPGPLPAGEQRDKKRYQRTMTPNTLRSKLQEKLISSFDTNELAGTIASIQNSPKSDASAKTNSAAPKVEETADNGEVSLPPCGPRRPRRSSRGTLGDGEGPTDKIEIDSENIETPPVTRRAFGSRPFRTRDEESPQPTTTTIRTTPAPEPTTNNRVKGDNDDDELGDGRFDRYSSTRRTRRFRKAPEGAEEDSTNLEPRKSPEGVEDPEESHVQADGVIVGMEVKKVRPLK